jgi:hypothetical protein
MTTASVERINVNFPRPVLDDLRALVPAKRRSEVIARATARELRRLKFAALFEALEQAPMWLGDAYPDLADGPAIDAFVTALRQSGAYVQTGADTPPNPRRKGRRE